MVMFPGCRCGNCGCTCGALPYTTTVQFSDLVNQTHSGHCAISFSSSFGGGAVAVMMEPGGCDDNQPECGPSDRGPITGILVTDGGSCYARYLRVEPTLTLSAAPGTGAYFTPTLTASGDPACRDYWAISAVTVSGGTGYSDGSAVTIQPDAGVATLSSASLTLRTSHTAPSLAATVAGGTGATLSVNVAAIGTTWEIDSIDVVAGGSGYTNGAAVVISLSAGDVATTPAVATITTGSSYSLPDDIQITSEIASGTGATFSYSFTEGTWGDGHPYWYLSGVTVTSGGSGYTVGDGFNVASPTCPSLASDAYFTVAAVDGGGAITAVAIDELFPGSFRKTTSAGAIASVTVTAAGVYFHDTGVPYSVVVGSGGQYYAEDRDSPPCVADIAVDASACGGTDAVLTAVVGVDPDDPSTFGKITGVTIDDGGDGYLAWRWVCLPHETLNGKDIVLKASNPKKLVTLHFQSCHGSGACATVDAIGDTVTCEDNEITLEWDGTPTDIRQVTLTNGGSGYAKLGREEPVLTLTTVAGFGATFTPAFGQYSDDCGLDYWVIESIAVSGGGSYVNGASLTITPATLNDKTQVAAVATVVVEGGVPQSVTVTNGGKYYRENAALTPYVATVTVVVDQATGSSGSGATITATVEDNTASPDFGKITALAIDDGGSGYSILGAPTDCTYSGGCGLLCSVYNPIVTLTTRGGKPAEVTLFDPRYPEECDIAPHYSVYRSVDIVGDCGTLPDTADLLYGAPSGSVAISAGGVWDSRGTADCGDKCSPHGCPDFGSLCISYEFTDISSTTYNWNEGDPEFPPCLGIIIQCFECGDFATPQLVIIAEYQPALCEDYEAGDCVCTTIYGTFAKSTDPDDATWYLGTFTVPMVWIGCGDTTGCVDPPPSLTVTIAAGPCP